jgi:hypothetical protein
MKYINQEILKIFSRVKDLLPLERKMREDRNVVVPGSGNGKGFIRRGSPRPWKPLPSIWKFEIHLAVHDWLLLLFGLFRRYDSATTLYGWKNGKANLYVDYMFKRLRKEVKAKKYDQAAKTMWILMNSHSYQVCCFNYIAKGWYKTMKLSLVKSTMKKVKRLAKTRANNINYKRVYLEEPTKWRPLGVPTLAWRVYLHMYNNLLTEWRLVTEKGNQHAYLPGKGVITAWEHLFHLLHTEPNVYEADFKGFFNNIEITELNEILKGLGFPAAELHFIEDLNKSQPKLEKEDKADEFKTRQFNYISHCLANEIAPSGPYWEPIRQTIEDAFGSSDPEQSELLKECLLEGCGTYWELSDLRRNPGFVLLKYVEIQWALLSSFGKETKFHDMLKGVPQGAPTSCSLATLALRRLEEKLKVLFYADDVFYFPEKAEGDHAKALEDEDLGLIIQPSKSRMVKANHEWVTDKVKFLGFSYYPASYTDTIWESMGYYFWMILLIDLMVIGFPIFSPLFAYIAYKQRYERHKPRFCAATRNGATLEFGDKESLIMYLNNARTLLLNASVKQELGGKALNVFLTRNFARYLNIRNPVGLLFEELTHRKLKGIKFLGPGVKLGRDIISESDYNLLDPIIKRWKGKGGVRRFDSAMDLWDVSHIKLTGWMMSRLQINSWENSIKQDFRLRPSKGSWLDLCWHSYRRSMGLSHKVLSTFTASSFACHDLLMWRKKDRKGKVRFNSTASQSKRKGGKIPKR